MEWVIDYVDIMDSIINIVFLFVVGFDVIGYNLIMCMVILNDFDFNGGNYVG